MPGFLHQMLSHKTNTKGSHHRKNCLLGFIEKCLDDHTLSHLIRWRDESTGIFQVLWVHAGRSSYHKKTHGSLFDLYREYRGRGMSSDPKQAFRMALKKSPCVRAILNGSRDWRAFRIIQKCHKICTAENSEEDFMKIFSFTSHTTEEQKMKVQTQEIKGGFSGSRKDFEAANQKTLSLRNDDDIVKNGWKYQDNYEMNSWNSQFPKYDTDFSWNPEASLLDFLDSLADLPEDSNPKTRQSPISRISSFSNGSLPLYQNSRSFSEISDKHLSDSNLLNQNYDLVHSTLTEVTPTSSNTMSIQSNLDEDPYISVEREIYGSPIVMDNAPRPSSCSALKHHPCQCLHYHVSAPKQVIEEIMPCDTVGVSPWILSIPSNQNRNNSSKWNTEQKLVGNEQINSSQEKNVFNQIAFEIERAAIDRLLEEEKNCFDAMFHCGDNLYPEQASPNMPDPNDYSTTVKTNEENSWLSPSCLRPDNISVNFSPNSDFISYTKHKLSSESVYYGFEKVAK